jgi:hypothetical protein
VPAYRIAALLGRRVSLTLRNQIVAAETGSSHPNLAVTIFYPSQSGEGIALIDSSSLTSMAFASRKFNAHLEHFDSGNGNTTGNRPIILTYGDFPHLGQAKTISSTNINNKDAWNIIFDIGMFTTVWVVTLRGIAKELAAIKSGALRKKKPNLSLSMIKILAPGDV